jgi:hypothetical protein
MAAATLALGQGVGERLYAPTRSIADQQISVHPWGSGAIAETDELSFEGGRSIRVSTRNFFQGGRIQFGQPVDLNRQFGDPNNLLRLTFFLPEGSMTFGGGGGGGPATGGAAGGALGGADGGAGGAAGLGTGEGAGGARGGRGAGAGAAAPTPPVTQFRAIVTTTDGRRSEAYLPIASAGRTERDWMTISIPLQAIRGFDRTNRTVKEIAISADSTTTFWVGDMRIVQDTTPIRAETNVQGRTLNLAMNDAFDFSARGFGGSSILRYVWTFRDDRGRETQAEGAAIRRIFRTPGKHVVTLRVEDYYGLKQPYTTSVEVTVNP